MEFEQYIRIVKKWLWLIAAGTLLAAGVAFGVSSVLPPVYRASVSLLVRTTEGEGDDYFEISRHAYPSKQESLTRAKVEIELEQKIAAVIKENRAMIMAPGLIKLEVLEATLFTFEHVHEKILEEIDEIYGK